MCAKSRRLLVARGKSSARAVAATQASCTLRVRPMDWACGPRHTRWVGTDVTTRRSCDPARYALLDRPGGLSHIGRAWGSPGTGWSPVPTLLGHNDDPHG